MGALNLLERSGLGFGRGWRYGLGPGWQSWPQPSQRTTLDQKTATGPTLENWGKGLGSARKVGSEDVGQGQAQTPHARPNCEQARPFNCERSL
eukprot:1322812-Alexandrium_andersonii.AAC.2